MGFIWQKYREHLSTLDGPQHERNVPAQRALILGHTTLVRTGACIAMQLSIKTRRERRNNVIIPNGMRSICRWMKRDQSDWRPEYCISLLKRVMNGMSLSSEEAIRAIFRFLICLPCFFCSSQLTSTGERHKLWRRAKKDGFMRRFLWICSSRKRC